jgi:UDP-3-O-[3-hydroxymyristoyl] glucosamine N-acyltransferase
MPHGPFRLAEIVARFGGELVGEGDVLVHQVATLGGAAPGEISFLTHPRYRGELAATRAAAVIVPESERAATTLPRIVRRDPYAYFARVSALFNPPAPSEPGVHPAAVVAAGARVAASASVGPACVVEHGASVGDDTVLGAGCFVGEGASIGAGSRLHPHVTVAARCVVGPRAILHPGAVIGADGFGFAPDSGEWLKIPQVGRVVIGADVEIGANSSVDRGAIDDTIIEDGVKIDNQVQIGHNCRIGAHTAIAGCVGIAGSTRIGRHCRIGGAAMIAGHLEIADHTIVAGGSGIAKSIRQAGFYSSALPASDAPAWRRTVALLRGLDRLADRVRELERRLADLEQPR